jgi:enolase
MPTLSSLHARQILDSRGNPTIEVDVLLSDGSFGRAAVPSGASTGSHEALELRDGDKSVYMGKSVRKAVANVNESIAKHIVGMDASDQRAVDSAMLTLDGTPNKSVLGANAILGVSMAVARARAVSEKQSLWSSLASQFALIPSPSPMGRGETFCLPVPMMNVINGGAHADSGLSFQECMIVPTDFSSFSEALRAGAEIFHTLKKILKDFGHVTAVGDEGGFAPHVNDSYDALSILTQAISQAGYEGRVQLALDCAASEFYRDGVYTVDGKQMTSSELVDFYESLISSFPIVSIEDSHSEDDWTGFAQMQSRFGDRVQLVGDDLFVTNVERVKKGIAENAANAVLIKVNQIGSLSETVDTIQLCQKNGWNSIASHRSGETEDSFIADLAVGLQTGQIKTGSLSRTDRICKYNQLLRIEEELGDKAEYAKVFGE